MDTLESGWLTMGPRTQDLEAAFAELGAAPSTRRGVERHRRPFTWRASRPASARATR